MARQRLLTGMKGNERARKIRVTCAV